MGGRGRQISEFEANLSTEFQGSLRGGKKKQNNIKIKVAELRQESPHQSNLKLHQTLRYAHITHTRNEARKQTLQTKSTAVTPSLNPFYLYFRISKRKHCSPYSIMRLRNNLGSVPSKWQQLSKDSSNSPTPQYETGFSQHKCLKASLSK